MMMIVSGKIHKSKYSDMAAKNTHGPMVYGTVATTQEKSSPPPMMVMTDHVNSNNAMLSKTSSASQTSI